MPPMAWYVVHTYSGFENKAKAALEAAQVHADLKPVQQLLEVVRSPYQWRSGLDEFLSGPEGGDAGYQTFCGT